MKESATEPSGKVKKEYEGLDEKTRKETMKTPYQWWKSIKKNRLPILKFADKIPPLNIPKYWYKNKINRAKFNDLLQFSTMDPTPEKYATDIEKDDPYIGQREKYLGITTIQTLGINPPIVIKYSENIEILRKQIGDWTKNNLQIDDIFKTIHSIPHYNTINQWFKNITPVHRVDEDKMVGIMLSGFFFTY